jgi:four helix bundle protein
MPIQSYQDLTVWKEGIQLSISVYRITTEFPPDEKFGLVSQMRRCAVSIPSNIAEGHARLSTREFWRHISIALGSLAELETQLHIAGELGYTASENIQAVKSIASRLGKQLRGLTKSLTRRIDGAPMTNRDRGVHS